MNPTVIPYLDWISILTLLTTTGGTWHGAIAHLYQNNFTPTPGMTLASLTEADYTGYAASSALTWGTPGFLPAGPAVVTANLVSFVSGATPTLFNTVYGYYITDSPATVLHFARLFQAPIIISGPLQIIDVIPSYVTTLSS